MAGTGTLAVTPGTGATVNTLPPSGQTTSANSLPVVLASDHTPVPVAAPAVVAALAGLPATLGPKAPAVALAVTLDTSVETAPGTSAAAAVGVQGVTGGVPVPVLDSSVVSALNAAATPTSTKGNPTSQMLTTQDGNAVLLFPAVSSTATGVVGSAVSLAGDGASFNIFALQITSLATGGSINIQGTIDGVNWVNLRANQAVSEIVSSSLGSTGIYEVEVSMCAAVRVNQSAYGSGTTTVQGLFRKSSFSPRTVNTGSGAQSAGVALSGNMSRNAIKAANAAPTAVANGAAVDQLATLLGANVTKPYSLPELDWSYAGASGGVTGTATVNIVLASTGNRQYLTELDLKNISGTASEIAVYDGSTSGAVLWRGHLSASMVSAEKFRFDNPLHSTAGNGLAIALATTGTQTYINASGYTAP